MLQPSHHQCPHNILDDRTICQHCLLQQIGAHTNNMEYFVANMRFTQNMGQLYCYVNYLYFKSRLIQSV